MEKPPAQSVILISTCIPGGIRSMIRAIQESELASRWRLSVICSHDQGSLARRLSLALRAYLSCLWKLLWQRPSLLHIHAAERGSFFRKSIFVWMAKLFGVPVIMHMHAAEFREFHQGCPPWVRRYISLTLDQCRRVIALSESWRRFYEGLTRTPIEVLPNFVGSASGAIPSASGPGNGAAVGLLYLGKFGARKGIQDLIQAVRSLYEDFPELEVFCGGDGEVERARREVDEAGMTERFHVLGWVGPERRSELLGRCQIYVLPSHAEGLPVAIIEAMAAGLSIVATRVGGIPEMLEDGRDGLLVPAGDRRALAAALESLLRDADYRRLMGQAARQRYLDTFSDKVVIPRLDSLYAAVARG